MNHVLQRLKFDATKKHLLLLLWLTLLLQIYLFKNKSIKLLKDITYAAQQ